MTPAARDGMVFTGCLILFAFWMGLEVGMVSKPKVCPMVDGKQAVSTVNTPQGEYCMYERVTKTKKARRV